MTESGQRLLTEFYPPFLWRDPLIQAVCNAYGEELDNLATLTDQVQENTIAITATDFLGLFEILLGLGVENPGLTFDQRKATVLAAFSRAALTGSGEDWTRIINQIMGSVIWSYEITGAEFSTLEIFAPFEAGSIQSSIIEDMIETVTPASMVIVVNPDPGFYLDESPLDEDIL